MKTKLRHNLKKLTVSALFAALTCLSTLIVLTYSPAGGYIHLGDCFVLLSGFLLGPLWGGLAAGLGSALTDLFLGYATYIPATFVIKWGVAALASVLMMLMSRNNTRLSIVKRAVAACAGECIMVGGYFAYECILYGFAGALSGVVPNIIQGVSGVVLASVLMIPLTKIGYIKRFFE
ncbi:MAG: ECF transporter S component [Clostridia bacterium]|nr:ECF transporter S component [Clostridia bacterium]